MKYGDLTLDRAILEIRYAKAYLLWDRAGQLWKTCEEKWPHLSNTEAHPAQSVFRLDTEEASYELVVELEAARVLGYRPKSNLREFSEIVSDFFGAVISCLELTEFQRIGFRTINVLPTKTMEEAIGITNDLALLRIPEGKAFGFDRKEAAPEIILNIIGEEVGARLRITSQRTVFEITPPPAMFEKPTIKTEFGVAYDIDYYTLSRVDVAQMSFVEWISNTLHLIRRDSDDFLKGP